MAKKSMKRQGFAELFFESSEPTLEEVSFKKFLKRFPEGTYEFEGDTIEGDEIEGEAEFTHVIPCGSEHLSAAGANTAIDPIVISWDFVTQVVDVDNSEFGDVRCMYSADLEIVGYRLEVEWEDDAEVVHLFGVDLKAAQNSVTVSPEFIPSGQDYQYEVMTVAVSGNQTTAGGKATSF